MMNALFRLRWVAIAGLAAGLGCTPSAAKLGPRHTVIRAPQDASDAKTANRVARGDAAPLEAVGFMSFIGIEYGDTVDRFFDLYGQPDSIDRDPEYNFNTGYYLDRDGEPGLEVSWLKKGGEVMTLQVRSKAARTYVSNRVSEPRLRFLFQHRDKIIETFGEPDDDHSDNYVYEFEVGEGSGDVTFICYDHDEHLCREIFVQWYF